jgi:large subunit ribosomal protein L21
MAHAVIRTGGKQYRVTEGETIAVSKLVGEPGSKVEFGEVLLLSGDTAKVGKPTIAGAKVSGEIVAHELDEKIIIFKFKRRKNYSRKKGHRQQLTSVKITGITG